MYDDRNIYKLFGLKKCIDSVKKSTDIIYHMKAFIVGMSLTFIGILFIIASAVSTTNISSTNTGFAGVIMLGPVPIVIGAGNPSIMPMMFAFALAFTIIALLFYLIPILLARKAKQ
ncbi:TIGR00304 family membrane protein [Stygiolobus caldivivus]|uniref:DUF131 domain-containing protein n=1 Tax=Stygiolobus caldivivus TaxID=2824673 RepID=A0A8D5U809_9CREN|nr:DUF131 domain-containing protein [Stygiolobus caldivivus]BCU70745.1 hypothetical protein KN1_20420 [Stygiolobus caldivivus]